MKLKSKFMLLTAVAVTVALCNAVVSKWSGDKLAALSEQQQMMTIIIQHHMDGDMKHDSIRADVMTAIVDDKLHNDKGIEEAEQAFKQDFQDFSKDVDDNLASPLPDNIKQQLLVVKSSVKTYGEMGQELIAIAKDPAREVTNLEGFIAIFEKLEKDQDVASDMILAQAKATKNEWGQFNDFSAAIKLILSLINLGLALLVPFFAIRGILKPQSEMIYAMNSIAEGNTNTVIPYTQRQDEMGEMARTVQVFKDNALRIKTLAEDQEQQKKTSEEQRRNSLQAMATTFENNVKSVVDIVASAATEMDATSRSVANITKTNQHKLLRLTDEIQGTSRNVQMVASATTQLSSAVNEISSQVARANTIASNAVEEASRADGTVQSLTAAANHIGEVLEMINSIAAQINLLALNATIEAARAGDAGKGFAVVASEVKNLANQTTKATEQISEYITSIQGATSETVSAIKRIGSTINEISAISTTIAAAVEEQGVATQDIANNVQQAAKGTETVSHDAADMSASSTETGEAANQMMDATSELSRQAETLRTEVDKFLVGVRNG